MQKVIIIVGIMLIIIGIIWPFVTHYLNLGRLPGDIIIKKNGFIFYFPIITSLIVSIVISVLLWFLSK